MGNVIPLWREISPTVRGLFVITDPGRDQDDEDTLVLMNRYIRMELLNTLGVVANLQPSRMRARLAKGTLKELGQDEIPVGWGSGQKQKDDDGLAYEFDVSYLADASETLNGEQLIYDTLCQAPEKGVVLVLISQLTDAANAFRNNPDLFKRKVRRVVIMGGVVADGNHKVALDELGRIIPDPTAQNHKFDLEATEFLYNALQMNNIGITVVSRYAAGGAKVPRSMYDDMAATGHSVGIRVYEAQKKAIELLWQRTHMELDDPNRHGLPERCGPDWFSNVFLGGNGKDRNGSDSIWDLLQTFQLYDPMTLIAAIPTLRNYFYDSYVVEVMGVEHHVIGISADRHGVSRPEELSEYLASSLVESLMMTLEARVA